MSCDVLHVAGVCGVFAVHVNRVSLLLFVFGRCVVGLVGCVVCWRVGCCWLSLVVDGC